MRRSPYSASATSCGSVDAEGDEGKKDMTDDRGQDPQNRVPTGAELTALDPAFRTDPYPVLTHLRGREPVHYDQVINRWVLTRAQDIERVLRDRSMSVDPPKRQTRART